MQKANARPPLPDEVHLQLMVWHGVMHDKVIASSQAALGKRVTCYTAGFLLKFFSSTSDARERQSRVLSHRSVKARKYSREQSKSTDVLYSF